jgi:prokaryotic ubiquitin-like protein Pup
MPTKDSGGHKRDTRRTDADEVEDADAAPADDLKERQEKLTDDIDSILDEIDETLEENAEDFVRSFVQKGGQ